MAVKSGSADFMKLGLGVDAVTLLCLLKNWIPEFKPFFALFLVEALSLAKLAL